MTMFGLPVSRPAARLACCHRRFRASPPSIAASDEPVVEQPTARCGSSACHSDESITTDLVSSSAVWGYSSLSIMFLSKHSAISSRASGSIHVVTNVARFIRALPSSISSSWMIWYAVLWCISPSGSAYFGTRVVSAPRANRGLISASCARGLLRAPV